MRRSQDLPVDRPQGRFSGRGLLIVLGGLFLFVLVFGRAIARFYVDYLWHDSLERNDVFWGAIGAKVTMFVGFFLVFALIAGVNLYLADRTAPDSFPANVHPYVERFHEVFGRRLRLLRYGVAGLFALLLATPAIARWQEWLLFRNSQRFGSSDTQFGRDVGFYVFELPFLTFLLDWMFAAVIVVLLLTIAAHILNGGVVFVSPVPVIRSATKTHVAVLLAILAVLKAGDYWLDRFELTNAQTGIVQGATYSVVQARLPALMLLILIALLTAVMYLSVARTGSLRAPFIASGLWLVVSIFGGVIYPAIVQGIFVNPDQEAKEAEYIERNVNATRLAYGLADVQVREVTFDDLTTTEVEADVEAFDNVRLLKPSEMLSRFVFDQGQETNLTIRDLDVDRFALSPGGEPEQVLVAALELNTAGLANRTWQGERLSNTRGCGLVVAAANTVTNSRPSYTRPDLDRPELYFSPQVGGYAITNTSSTENSCDLEIRDDDEAATSSEEYTGTMGVRINSLARRASVALAFLDRNVLLSGAITNDSQMLWVRNINERLNKLAPFLSYDADPYPVELDGGVVWVVDGYTTTSRYPYSESIGSVQLTSGSGLSPNDNYVRNSVKAVVDAYTGEVTLYVVDEVDPIIKAWQSAFPDLFTDFDEMPAELVGHLRYPEDLFRVQTDRYSKYRISASAFFQRRGAWSVAQAPGSTPGERGGGTNEVPPSEVTAANSTFARETNVARFVPYYTYFDTSAADEPRNREFVIFRPFVDFSTDDSRTQLEAYMVASSDPETYGQLTSYTVRPVDGESLPDGPLRVASNGESTNPDISRQISNDNQEDSGTSVRFGDLQAIPVADGLVYVRPYYVSVQTGIAQAPQAPEYRGVIVTYDERSVLAGSTGEALAELFPGFDAEVDENVSVEINRPVVELGQDAEAVIIQIDELLREADAARNAGDLALLQEKLDAVNELATDAIVRFDLGQTAVPEADANADADADAGEPVEADTEE
jgi:uncharacterized membrane protein (UPF0182 family)